MKLARILCVVALFAAACGSDEQTVTGPTAEEVDAKIDALVPKIPEERYDPQPVEGSNPARRPGERSGVPAA